MKSDNPKISVIVPVYNAEKYLRRCIDSILNQTFTDFEVLLINDGSTDSSGTICDEYAKQDSRVRVFHKENGGVSSARNVGIENSLGEYLLFIDSDDAIVQGFIELLLRLLSDYSNPDCIAFNGLRYDDNILKGRLRQKSKTSYYKNMNDFIAENTFRKEVWLHLFQKKIISKNNIVFTTGIRYAEDLEFFIKYFSLCENILSSSFDGYINYSNVNSAMNKEFTKDNVLDHYRVIKNLESFYEVHKFSVSKEFFSNSIYHLMLTSIGFVYNQKRKLWVWLDFYFKKYYIKSVKIKNFTLFQNIVLFCMFITIMPFAIYFKIRKTS